MILYSLFVLIWALYVIIMFHNHSPYISQHTCIIRIIISKYTVVLPLFIGNEFFITDDPVIATPLGANDVRHSNRHTVSHCSSERLSLNSLFLRSLGDQDGIAPLVTTHNRIVQLCGGGNIGE